MQVCGVVWSAQNYPEEKLEMNQWRKRGFRLIHLRLEDLKNLKEKAIEILTRRLQKASFESSYWSGFEALNYEAQTVIGHVTSSESSLLNTHKKSCR